MEEMNYGTRLSIVMMGLGSPNKAKALCRRYHIDGKQYVRMQSCVLNGPTGIEVDQIRKAHPNAMPAQPVKLLSDAHEYKVMGELQGSLVSMMSEV